jgi:hypothetical protein
VKYWINIFFAPFVPLILPHGTPEIHPQASPNLPASLASIDLRDNPGKLNPNLISEQLPTLFVLKDASIKI